MSRDPYIPDRGDIIWLVLDPRVGHEQSGRRPAIVLSERYFTEHTQLAVICPITSKVKGLPFEIVIKTENIDGAILPIHIRSVDVMARKAKFIEHASEAIIAKTSKATELIMS
ncbi:MAG TPA: type II toxin-antitoxin system PemK/MazF family toxin [Candidatus Saccharimonadales bacterium]|nr:type II toxin-antitoxin system PemK/MazF family toxin [Candidatus Saccharimonadales bacterium]